MSEQTLCRLRDVVVAVMAGLTFALRAHAVPVGTGFTYQGQLTDLGTPADGGYDFRFTLDSCDVAGTQVGPTLTLDNVAVTNGLFTVELDFGAVFTGEGRCLEIAVRPGAATGNDPYTTLDPRQTLTPAPHAIYALSSGGAPWSGLTGVPAGFLDGTDNDTMYRSGNGLSLIDNEFRINFGGSGIAQSAARSDHNHDTSYWKLDGNTGTSPGTNFLGTRDNTALQLHVANARALRLEPGAVSPNLIGGYSGNGATAGVQGATVAGGGADAATNRVTDRFGTIGGGANNQAGDGLGSTEDRTYATVGGGLHNVAAGASATVGGGSDNSASARFATVNGGVSGGASGDYAVVGGGEGGQAQGDYALVAGGLNNTASADRATVSGGSTNTASADRATVSGGSTNTASGMNATVSGGVSNTATNTFATVGGGNTNVARGFGATIAGGGGNSADGDGASVLGGSTNSAAGAVATVAGGEQNNADAAYSFAAGRRAKALSQGSFVWADSTNADFTATQPDQFAIRAANGVRLSVNAGSDKTIGVGQHYRDNALVAWAKVLIDTQNNNAPTLQEEFGVSNVTRSAAGNYTVNINASAGAAARLIPMAVAEVDAPPAAAANIRIVSVNQIDGDTFRVYINQGSGPLVDNDFIFMVTAR